MLNLKATAVAVLALGSSAVFAGTMGPACVPGDVTVPCEAKMWDLGIQALYLKSVYDSDRAYDSLFNVNNDYTEVDHKWDWGYRLEGSYHFNTGNDITMNWSHIDTDHDAGDFARTAAVSAGTVTLLFTTNALLNTKDKYDQINLVMGQHVDMGLIKNARFYGGLQYAKIRVASNAALQNLAAFIPPFIPISSIVIFDKTEFSGVGPVAGIDYAYDVTNEFSVTANTAGSILYGNARQNTGELINNALIALGTYSSMKTLVPSLEAKLGVNYGHAMAQGVLNVQAGYQVVNYFNALHGFLPLAFGPALAKSNSDYGLYGPYFGVKWVGQA